MTKARWFKAGLAILALAVFVSAGAPALPVSSAGTAKPVPGPGLPVASTGTAKPVGSPAPSLERGDTA